MVKSKKQEETPHKFKEKSKKPKASKQRKPAKESIGEDTAAKAASLSRKQTELARVLQLKCELLLKGNLSYLEYMELREELCRLNALKEKFAKKAASLEKY